MYGILTNSGLAVTHDTTRNKVYEFTKHSGHSRMRNDNGLRQDVYPHDFLEIPRGSFVGSIPAHYKEGFVGTSDSGYRRDNPYIMELSDKTCRFTDDEDTSIVVDRRAVEVIADPWGLVDVPKSAKFFPQRRLRLLESVGPFKAGDDVFADRTNISGSYMVPSPFGSGGAVIVKPQICTVIEPGKVTEVKIQGGYQVEPSKLTGEKQPQPFQIQQAPKGVKKQKTVAQELLKYATMMDPHAMLAGGAPRNWHLGLEANDLDIFIRPHRSVAEAYMRDTMRRIGITSVFNKADEEAPGVKKANRYSQKNCNADQLASSQKIQYVLEGKYMGETVQFIVLNENSTIGLDYCQRYFDTSINMISMSLGCNSDELVESRSPRFDDSMKTGVIFVQENGSAYGNGNHLERIHSYFPEAPMVREKYREEVVRNPEKAFKLAEDWEALI